MTKRINLIGQKFGRLTVTKYVGKRKWECRCDCGKNTTVRGDHLREGHTMSCGCYLNNRILETKTTHGMAKSRLYRIWRNIKTRCENKSAKGYERYGGKGITVCPEWRESFEAFRDWAQANGYRDDLTIDRIDNSGDYCPENCRWKTIKEQQNNRSNNKVITHNGETLSVAEWSRKTGISEGTIRSRINYGWEPERILKKSEN